MSPPDPETILVYSMGEVIGDGLIKLPFVTGLRGAFPNAQITWCAAKGSTVYTGPLRRVVEGAIDHVRLGPPERGRRYDLAIDTQQNAFRTLAAWRCSRRLVSGAAGWSRFVGPGRWPEALTGRLGALLDVARPGATLRPVILADPRARRVAEDLLPPGARYVGFAPGAGGLEKRWPLDRYLELAGRAQAAGCTPVFFVGPDEAADLPAIRAVLPQARLPEHDRTDSFDDVRGPLLVIALAARLEAAVANDAGPGHMFAAGGAPLLSLQKDRRKALKFRPAARRLEMLTAEDYGPGMDALPVDDAWARLSRLLDL
jgi:ADP-heptose:LPS heptosyltransferase